MISAALLACVLVQGQPHDVACSPQIRVGVNFDFGSVFGRRDDCTPRRDTCHTPVMVERQVVIERPVVVQRQVVVERPVCVERPVVVERPVCVDRPVYVNRPVYVERPVYVDRCGHPEYRYVYRESRESWGCGRMEVRRQVVVADRHDGCRR